MPVAPTSGSILTSRYQAVSRRSLWVPPAGVKTHAGQLIESEMDFFSPPPETLGKPISASTTLKQGREPWSLPARLVMTVGVGSVLAAAAWYVPGMFRMRDDDRLLLYFMGAVVTSAWLAASIYFTRFEHECSYACEAGMAIFKLKGSRDRPQEQVIRFADLAGVRTAETRHYHNGIYTGTHYDYQFYDTSGTNRVLRLKGTYYSTKGTPKPKSPYYTALAMEAAWNAFLVSTLDDVLARQGWVQFDLAAGKWVRIGRGFIEFHLDRSGQATRVEAGDIGKLNLASGQFSIRHKDAKWLSGQGKYSFAYSQLMNAKAFVICLQVLLGYTFPQVA